ncbi:uncharacterized [Tachysurus ichikawai]
MCLAFPQCTANERSRAGPLGGKVPISQNEQPKRAEVEKRAGYMVGAGDSIAVLLTLFSTDSPEGKKPTNLPLAPALSS